MESVKRYTSVITGHTSSTLTYTKAGDHLELKRDCGMGCFCEAEIFKPKIPVTLEDARNDILCFNDFTSEGISGNGCEGQTIQDGPNVWIFKVNAKLSKIVKTETKDNTPQPKARRFIEVDQDIDGKPVYSEMIDDDRIPF